MRADTGSERIADGPDDLTAPWLSAVLGRHVEAVTVERIGTGQTGAAYRLGLEGSDGPATLVAKLAAGDEEARRRVRNGYRSEVGFYGDIAPTVAVRTPRCWHAAISDDGTAFTLLLDDLSPRAPGVQADGCSVAQAGGAVANLAALHAPRWNDESLFDLRYLHRPTPEGAAFLASMVAPATEAFVDRFAHVLDPADVTTLRDAAAAMATWLVHRTEPFSVVHGDYRLDNLLFGDDPDDVVVVDWQTLAAGPPTRDLAYFLGTSLTTEDRRAAEEALVARYHDELRARGVEGYDAERCVEDYRLGQLQAPMITTIGCAYATGERSDASDEMFLAMARRSCAAIRDLGTLDLL